MVEDLNPEGNIFLTVAENKIYGSMLMPRFLYFSLILCRRPEAPKVISSK